MRAFSSFSPLSCHWYTQTEYCSTVALTVPVDLGWCHIWKSISTVQPQQNQQISSPKPWLQSVRAPTTLGSVEETTVAGNPPVILIDVFTREMFVSTDRSSALLAKPSEKTSQILPLRAPLGPHTLRNHLVQAVRPPRGGLQRSAWVHPTTNHPPSLKVIGSSVSRSGTVSTCLEYPRRLFWHWKFL
jgi:hypothetical protein